MWTLDLRSLPKSRSEPHPHPHPCPRRRSPTPQHTHPRPKPKPSPFIQPLHALAPGCGGLAGAKGMTELGRTLRTGKPASRFSQLTPRGDPEAPPQPLRALTFPIAGQLGWGRPPAPHLTSVLAYSGALK